MVVAQLQLSALACPALPWPCLSRTDGSAHHTFPESDTTLWTNRKSVAHCFLILLPRWGSRWAQEAGCLGRGTATAVPGSWHHTERVLDSDISALKCKWHYSIALLLHPNKLLWFRVYACLLVTELLTAHIASKPASQAAHSHAMAAPGWAQCFGGWAGPDPCSDNLNPI